MPMSASVALKEVITMMIVTVNYIVCVYVLYFFHMAVLKEYIKVELLVLLWLPHFTAEKVDTD